MRTIVYAMACLALAWTVVGQTTGVQTIEQSEAASYTGGDNCNWCSISPTLVRCSSTCEGDWWINCVMSAGNNGKECVDQGGGCGVCEDMGPGSEDEGCADC